MTVAEFLRNVSPEEGISALSRENERPFSADHSCEVLRIAAAHRNY